MKIIDGKNISEEIKKNLKIQIEKENLEPGLAIVMVGHNAASEVYVRNKLRASEKVGVHTKLWHFESDVSESEVIDCILKLNQDEAIHGIIVQSPLPTGFDEDKITGYIIPSKDVDGFGIYSLGNLAANEESFLSATPAGIIELLKHENINISGKNVVIVGRSKIVGRPMALALLNRDATVTVTHSKTKNLKDITKMADIVIVAVGKPNFITEDYIKDGAVVIDVGINRLENGKLVGDVDFDSVSNKAAYITPVPGGVGPMTIAMLLSNTVESAIHFKQGKDINVWIRELKKHY